MGEVKFVNGKLVEVIGDMCPGKPNSVLIKVLRDYSKPGSILADSLVDKRALEEPIDKVFKLGETVKNKYGSMIGTVCAFELDTNKAVVRSSKLDKYENKRTRYVYGVKELEKYDPDKITIKPGKYYQVDGEQMFAAESILCEGQIMFFDKKGQIKYSNIPAETSINKLEYLFGLRLKDPN